MKLFVLYWEQGIISYDDLYYLADALWDTTRRAGVREITSGTYGPLDGSGNLVQAVEFQLSYPPP